MEIKKSQVEIKYIYKRFFFTKLLFKILQMIYYFYWRNKFYYFGVKSTLIKPLLINGTKYMKIGKNVQIWKLARIEAFSIGKEPVLIIGDNTIIHPLVHIGAMKNITIGKSVLIASNVYITDHDHDFTNPFNPAITNNMLIANDVNIQDYVWLGEKVIVLKGVTIGERSIIGAGSVVTKDIPPFSIAVGNPAKVICEYSFLQKKWIRVGKKNKADVDG